VSELQVEVGWLVRVRDRSQDAEGEVVDVTSLPGGTIVQIREEQSGGRRAKTHVRWASSVEVIAQPIAGRPG
jgi:hypothetical protein